VQRNQRTSLQAVDWNDAASSLVERGWVRLERVVDADTCGRMAEAAPPTWTPLPEEEGEVHQGGQRSGVFFDDAASTVQRFGRTICDGLTNAAKDVPPVPCFNEVQWGRSHDGAGYITAHRDPPGAGGVIAIVTLRGRARFRVWRGSHATEWKTADGDLVILRGNGWPSDDARCPVHEVESRGDDRMTMTLRHNTLGPGGDYFAWQRA
jgi:hypothetical protein